MGRFLTPAMPNDKGGQTNILPRTRIRLISDEDEPNMDTEKRKQVEYLKIQIGEGPHSVDHVEELPGGRKVLHILGFRKPVPFDFFKSVE